MSVWVGGSRELAGKAAATEAGQRNEISLTASHDSRHKGGTHVAPSSLLKQPRTSDALRAHHAGKHAKVTDTIARVHARIGAHPHGSSLARAHARLISARSWVPVREQLHTLMHAGLPERLHAHESITTTSPCRHAHATETVHANRKLLLDPVPKHTLTST
eukprot:6176012-Pleurochrysis_carterae.AAC.2